MEMTIFVTCKPFVVKETKKTAGISHNIEFFLEGILQVREQVEGNLKFGLLFDDLVPRGDDARFPKVNFSPIVLLNVCFIAHY